ncbi:MAG TPA: glycosyltransferase family 4 protein [Vicinamibacterales bacterium]|nr:glycosyltransferase family 4 protein [Vicinamibacterales bacterium]
MRVGLVAPPFIPVPPVKYGGTELFVANLARGLHAKGHDVTVYANGDSRVECQLKWRYAHADWPVANAMAAQLKNDDHTAWAIHDAGRSVDLLHLNDIVGVPLTRFVNIPVVVTIHHMHEPALSDLYSKYPLDYVAISRAQARREQMPKIHVVPHGVPIDDYVFRARKEDYLAFLGRMAPCKGAHVAIEVARRAGMRLKLAGEIQPCFREYWERQILPHVDGRSIEYIGEADRSCKNELLSRARALLFPIDWDEPFGLVMIESMACGTPVLAFARGSVPEIVRDGVSGWICRDTHELAHRAVAPGIPAESCRDWVAECFSRERMVDRYLEIYRHALKEALNGRRHSISRPVLHPGYGVASSRAKRRPAAR